MTTQETIALFDNYVIANYGRLPRVMVKGEGSYLSDADGHKILDMFPGWAVSGIGHCHPKVVEAVRRQVGELIHIDNTFYSEPQGKLAQLLSERAFGGKCFFCNSGAGNRGGPGNCRVCTRRQVQVHHRRGQLPRPLSPSPPPAAQVHDGLPLLPFAYIPFNDVAALGGRFTDESPP